MLLLWQHLYYKGQLEELENADNTKIILVSKQDMQLRLYDFKGNLLFSAPVAVGRNSGNKGKIGDMRTPEGVFQVEDIERSDDWKHDFGDGKGSIQGAYGPYFIRLSVPGHKGIGIHGTHEPESMGTRVSEGCIRMRNEDIEQLVSLISLPLTVIVTPGADDEKTNELDNKNNKK